MPMYAISSKSAKRHAVAGELSDLAPQDAWRKAERTYCGRNIVPVNYYDLRGDNAAQEFRALTFVSYLCSECLRALELPAS